MPGPPGTPSEAERIDVLLAALDEVARDHGHHSYGLPLYEDGPAERMRDVVRGWLLLARAPR